MTAPVEPTDGEVAAAARALFLVQNDDGARWWDDFLTEDGRRVWCDDARPILAAALPLIRERIAVEIMAEYDKVAADEGATLESDRVIDGICNGMLRAIRIARGA